MASVMWSATAAIHARAFAATSVQPRGISCTGSILQARPWNYLSTPFLFTRRV